MEPRLDDPAVAGLLAAGRWDDAGARAGQLGADNVAGIIAAWHSGLPAETVVERARRLASNRPHLIGALELLAWFECAAGDLDTARELATKHGARSSRLQALGLAIRLASGEPVSGDPPPGTAGDLGGTLEVMALVESGDRASARRRAEAATQEPDALWLAWLARAVAESRAGDSGAALESAFVAYQSQPGAAEPSRALRLLARRRFTLPRSAAWFLLGIAFFALGAAQDERVGGVMSVAFVAAAVLAAIGGLAISFVRRRRLAALTAELRAALNDVVAFRYRETVLPAVLALVPLAALIPASGQPFLLSLSAGLAAALGFWVWRVYRVPVRLRPLLAFALTGLRIDVRKRPQRRWQRWRR